jgi:hypothetical protein
MSMREWRSAWSCHWTETPWVEITSKEQHKLQPPRTSRQQHRQYGPPEALRIVPHFLRSTCYEPQASKGTGISDASA